MVFTYCSVFSTVTRVQIAITDAPAIPQPKTSRNTSAARRSRGRHATRRASSAFSEAQALDLAAQLARPPRAGASAKRASILCASGPDHLYHVIRHTLGLDHPDPRALDRGRCDRAGTAERRLLQFAQSDSGAPPRRQRGQAGPRAGLRHGRHFARPQNRIAVRAMPCAQATSWATGTCSRAVWAEPEVAGPVVDRGDPGLVGSGWRRRSSCRTRRTCASEVRSRCTPSSVRRIGSSSATSADGTPPRSHSTRGGCRSSHSSCCC